MDCSVRGNNPNLSMPTVFEIVQHVILDKPYEKREFQPVKAGSQGSVTYKLLTEQTTNEILQKVRSFVSGNLPKGMLDIDSNSAHQYLAAAKIVDLDTNPSEMAKSTYKIREMIVLRSKAEPNGRAQINMINAFSMPPVHKKEFDILFTNELDNNHPIIKSASNAAERNNYLTGIYTYCQKEAEIVPEIVPILEAVVRDRYQTMLKVSAFLPAETSVIYKGCSGAGKSFAITKFTEKNITGINVEVAVQSTDNLKNDIVQRTQNIFNNQQSHLLGFSTFKMLSEVMKNKYPKLSTLQEGWFNSTFALDALFKDVKNAELKLEIHDFDGSFEALCLRVLNRYQFKDSAKPPFNQIEQAFKSTRESRGQLLKFLRETDSYQFSYVHANGTVDDQMPPTSAVSDPEGVNLEIKMTKELVITREHSQLFGDYLNLFLGMTIEEAFEKLRLM